jgi:ABC-type dipeptide/oligopeptide/nickel transport system permease subunit
LQISFSAAIISLMIGGALGVLGGLLDDIPGSVINVPLNWLMLPFSTMPMLLILLLVMVIDGPSKLALIWGMGLLGWTNVAALVRARVRSIRRGKLYQESPTLIDVSEEDDPEAEDEEAPATPASTNRVVWHLVIGPALLLVYLLAVNTASFLLMETALGFLGMGIQPPEPSLGAMLGDSRQYLVQAEHLIYAPGLAIMLTVACLSFVAEGIRSTFDFTA